MHIAEGFLPPAHAAGWTVAAAPFVAAGLWSLNRHLKAHPEARLLLGAAGAYALVLSALKLPSVAGSSSHATGVGFGAILFEPGVMAVLGTLVLLFQALLLAHGGLTTLGANAFAMAVVGPWVAYGVFRLGRRLGGTLMVATFLAAFAGNLATYVTTSLQLALAFPDPASGFAGAAAKFLSLFAFTQVPLALVEGALTAVLLNALVGYNPPELRQLALFSGAKT